MGCLLCIQSLIYILLQSPQWCIQHRVILDRVVTAPGYIRMHSLNKNMLRFKKKTLNFNLIGPMAMQVNVESSRALSPVPLQAYSRNRMTPFTVYLIKVIDWVIDFWKPPKLMMRPQTSQQIGVRIWHIILCHRISWRIGSKMNRCNKTCHNWHIEDGQSANQSINQSNNQSINLLERHVITNHWHLDSSFNSLFRP